MHAWHCAPKSNPALVMRSRRWPNKSRKKKITWFVEITKIKKKKSHQNNWRAESILVNGFRILGVERYTYQDCCTRNINMFGLWVSYCVIYCTRFSPRPGTHTQIDVFLFFVFCFASTCVMCLCVRWASMEVSVACESRQMARSAQQQKLFFNSTESESQRRQK